MDVKFLGIEEIEMVCQFCGKQEIGKVFTFLDVNTGNIVRFGSQCAKKALGFSTSQKMGKKLRQDIEAAFQSECLEARKAGDFSKDTISRISEKKQNAIDSLRRAGF